MRGRRLLVVLVALLLVLTVASASARQGRARLAGGATSPDFDGDGYADLAVGAPYDDAGVADAGSVTVIRGSATGLVTDGARAWSQDSAGIPGEARRGDNLGFAVAAADFDGDGFTDLAVGVINDAVGGIRAGAVNVLYGSPGGLTAESSQRWSQASEGIADVAEAGDQFGWSLVGADFDGDGFADLAVGSRFEDLGGVRDTGAVSVIYGSPDGLTAEGDQLWSQASPGITETLGVDEQFGRVLAAGNFDGDAFADLAVGVPYEDHDGERDGGVHVIRGSASGLTASGSQFWGQGSPGILQSPELRDQFGQSLAAGDFDDDAFDDLAVGVWFEDFCRICNEGGFHVLYGSGSGLSAAGNQFWTQDSAGILDRAEPFDRFGQALASADFDGDGFADLAVGVGQEDLGSAKVFQNKGAVALIYGSAAGLAAAGNQFWTKGSEGIEGIARYGDYFGEYVAGADLDGDGFADLVVGVPHEDHVAPDDGGVHVIRGSPSGVTASGDQVWWQDRGGIPGVGRAGDQWGWALTSRRPASGSPRWCC